MSFRNVHFTIPGKLSVRNNNLVFKESETQAETSIPLDDIFSVVVENRQIVITAAAMSVMAQKDIAVFFCDEKHLPNSISLPFQSFGKQLLRIEDQFSLSVPFKKNLWSSIVMQKILNQAAHLKCLGLSAYYTLENLSKRVTSGDKENAEGRASAIYFRELFGPTFSRDDEASPVNILLNYGYSLIRGSISRELAAHGFIPSIGIFHQNQYNNFNLSDDLIEPFRPSIDSRVVNMIKSKLVNISEPEVKRNLFKIFEDIVYCDDKNVTIKHCIQEVVDSLVTCIKTKSIAKLLLPEFKPLD